MLVICRSHRAESGFISLLVMENISYIILGTRFSFEDHSWLLSVDTAVKLTLQCSRLQPTRMMSSNLSSWRRPWSISTFYSVTTILSTWRSGSSTQRLTPCQSEGSILCTDPTKSSDCYQPNSIHSDNKFTRREGAGWVLFYRGWNQTFNTGLEGFRKYQEIIWDIAVIIKLGDDILTVNSN